MCDTFMLHYIIIKFFIPQDFQILEKNKVNLLQTSYQTFSKNLQTENRLLCRNMTWARVEVPKAHIHLALFRKLVIRGIKKREELGIIFANYKLCFLHFFFIALVDFFKATFQDLGFRSLKHISNTQKQFRTRVCVCD